MQFSNHTTHLFPNFEELSSFNLKHAEEIYENTTTLEATTLKSNIVDNVEICGVNECWLKQDICFVS